MNHYGADVNGLLTQLDNNLKNLKDVEDKQQAQEKTFLNIEHRFKQIEGGLEGHGKLLNSLSVTQTQQGTLLRTLNTKMDCSTKHISGHLLKTIRAPLFP